MSNETVTTVGDRIRGRREELGISLSRLSETSGVSRSYLHEIENGQSTTPSAEMLFNIAEALETSVAVLLGKRPNRNTNLTGQIPQALQEYANEAKLTEEEIHRLAHIKYRNRQPKKKEDWAFIHEAIKRAIGTTDK
jgi:transcriptional regulator with XRE-family HTH domain